MASRGSASVVIFGVMCLGGVALITLGLKVPKPAGRSISPTVAESDDGSAVPGRQPS